MASEAPRRLTLKMYRPEKDQTLPDWDVEEEEIEQEQVKGHYLFLTASG